MTLLGRRERTLYGGQTQQSATAVVVNESFLGQPLPEAAEHGPVVTLGEIPPFLPYLEFSPGVVGHAGCGGELSNADPSGYPPCNHHGDVDTHDREQIPQIFNREQVA